jgi:hypothetical protein
MYETKYETSGSGDLTSAIVFAVAEAAGTDPLELTWPPLYEYVDLDALESIFFGSETRASNLGGCVSFTYEGFDVQVWSDGTIQVAESA